MVYSPAKLAETGTAEFQNEENIRIHNDTPENMIPSPEFNRDKEIDKLTEVAVSNALDQGIQQYSAEGIAEIEQYLQKQEYNRPTHEHLRDIGEHVEFWRKSEIA